MADRRRLGQFDAGLPVATVLSDRPCAGLALADEHGVMAELVDRVDFGGFGPGFDCEAFTAAAAMAARLRLQARRRRLEAGA